MARHSPYTSRRTVTSSISSAKRGLVSAKAAYGHTPATYSRRDEIRGTRHLKYGNPTFLSQDRAEQKFGFDLNANPDWYGEDICEEVDREDYKLRSPDFVPDEYQYELPLKNTDELEKDLVDQIRKYRQAINHMAAAAIMWDDLMEDLEDDDDLAAQFDRFQMLRKLKGGQL